MPKYLMDTSCTVSTAQYTVLIDRSQPILPHERTPSQITRRGAFISSHFSENSRLSNNDDESTAVDGNGICNGITSA